jgi:acyl-CoA synthetase (NDP forming)
MTSGFNETDQREGRLLEDRIRALAAEHELRVIGPNCMGPYCPSSKLTAWGAIPGLSGSVGIISQSGGLTQRLTEYLASLGVGVSKAVSFGNATVLDSTDFLEYMAADDSIQVIAMYLESVKNARKLLQMARPINRDKPIILWKGGDSQSGAATAVSHTGALAGSQNMWTAFYRQTGVIRVQSLNEWADAVIAFSLLPATEGNGVFLIGGGGGNSVTSSDAFSREGFEMPPLSEATSKFLRRSVPTAGSIAGNPLDMWRIYTDADYLAEILNLGYQDPAISIIVIDHLIARKAFHFANTLDPTPLVIDHLTHQQPAKPTLVTIDTDGGDPDLAAAGARLRGEFCKAGFPAYPSAVRAARALGHLYRYHRNVPTRDSGN